ncbi:TPA: hypothetical protein DCW54_01890 [Candidatus Dependentiae bacterium]|nr:hypothetical protein [Candidatus Dependentiae bacterium]
MNKALAFLLASLATLGYQNTTTLHARVIKEKRELVKLGLYQHFRGNLYQVIGFARHSETLEELVVYQALYNGYGIWVRPFSMFTETVVHNGKIVPRFKYIGAGHTHTPRLKNSKSGK